MHMWFKTLLIFFSLLRFFKVKSIFSLRKNGTFLVSAVMVYKSFRSVGHNLKYAQKIV